MIRIDIPGKRVLEIKHLLMDYNGTLACDGILLESVAGRLQKLAELLDLHIVTADTFGDVREQLSSVSCTLNILTPGNQSEQKRIYTETLGPENTVAIGNGNNDRLMLREAALAIATIQDEGAVPETISAADIVVSNINRALDLLLRPKRLLATLRD